MTKYIYGTERIQAEFMSKEQDEYHLCQFLLLLKQVVFCKTVEKKLNQALNQTIIQVKLVQMSKIHSKKSDINQDKMFGQNKPRPP